MATIGAGRTGNTGTSGSDSESSSSSSSSTSRQEVGDVSSPAERAARRRREEERDRERSTGGSSGSGSSGPSGSSGSGGNGGSSSRPDPGSGSGGHTQAPGLDDSPSGDSSPAGGSGGDGNGSSQSRTSSDDPTRTGDPARDAARRRRQETRPEERRGHSPPSDQQQNPPESSDQNSQETPPVGGPPGTVERDDGTVGAPQNNNGGGSGGGGGSGPGGSDSGASDTPQSSPEFDQTNPEYDGQVYSSVEDDLIDRGASDIHYAETDDGLVARYEQDGQTRYAPIPVGTDGEQVTDIAENLQQDANEAAVAGQYEDVDANDIRFVDGELSRGSREEIGQAALAGTLGQETANEMQLGEDFTLDSESGEISLTPYGKKELARENVAEQTGLDDREGFEVTIDEGETQVSLTDEGREQLADRESDLRESVAAATEGSGELARGTDATDFATFEDEIARVEQQVESEHPGMERGDDYTVTITDEGEYQAEITEARQQELRDQANEGIAAQARSEGVDVDRLEAETGRDIDQDADVTTPEAYVASQVEESFDTVERGRDFEIVEQDDTLRPTYTDEGLTRIETELETAADGQLDYDVRRAEDGGIEASAERREQFGDGHLNIPSNVPLVGGRSLEENLEGASEAWQGVARGAGDAVEGFADLGAAGVESLPSDPATQRVPGAIRGVGDVGSGVAQGAVGVLDLAGGALMFKEAGETAGWLTKETSAGDGPDAVQTLGEAGYDAGGRAVQYAQENPGEAGGVLLGSMVGGYGAVKAAGRVGQGRAAAAAIEPGEAVASRAVTAGLSRTSRGARFVDDVGGHVGPEELVVYGGSKAAGKARRAASSSYETFKTSDFMQDTRAQGSLTGAGRSRSSDVDADAVETESAFQLEEAVEQDAKYIEQRRREERNELARQAQEQTIYEQEQEYGEYVYESVPDRGRSGYLEERSAERRATQEGSDIEYQDPFAGDELTQYQRQMLRGQSGATGDSAAIRGRAQRSEVFARSDTTPRLEADLRVGSDTRIAESELMREMAETEQVAREAAREQSRPDSDTRFDTGVDEGVDTGFEVDAGIDTGVDTGFDTDTSYADDGATTQIQSTEAVETRQPSRQQARTAARTSSDTRREWEYDRDPETFGADEEAAWSFDEDTWEVGIEDISDVVFDEPPNGGGR